MSSLPESIVHQSVIYPSVAAIARIRAVGIRFPNVCCVCGEPATRTFPDQPLSIFEKLKARYWYWHRTDVPHCDRHGGPNASLLSTILYPDKAFLCIFTIGFSREFADRLRDIHQDGDFYAPWVAFPYSYGPIGWNQGVNNEWWLECWTPFWLGLSEDDRKSYLIRWRANEMWREFLLEDQRWHTPPSTPGGSGT